MIEAMKAFRVTSLYGKRINPNTREEEFHTGIDLVKPAFSPIQAFVPGVVVHAKTGLGGTGVGRFSA